MVNEGAASGWIAQPEQVQLEYHRLFAARFAFHPDVEPSGWPSIEEPVPSMTLDLSSVATHHGMTMPAADDAILQLLVDAFPANVRLVAIDYNHVASWLWPHRFAASERGWPDSWYVHPYPNGDYTIFLTEDMTSGTFGHPWERTLCIVGSALIEAARPLIAQWAVIRRRPLP
ncbi:MAG: hypothetical protein DLM56_13000 [Pseudonocardiales bacterium]|nr:MAG: hypothetical protein DLM56_13000 [Pseudonocardiales bacterium]